MMLLSLSAGLGVECSEPGRAAEKQVGFRAPSGLPVACHAPCLASPQGATWSETPRHPSAAANSASNSVPEAVPLSMVLARPEPSPCWLAVAPWPVLLPPHAVRGLEVPLSWGDLAAGSHKFLSFVHQLRPVTQLLQTLPISA